MANSRARLTQTSVEKATPGPTRYIISDTEIPGFRLVVSPTGKKAFAFRYRVGGGRGATIREPKIGDFPSMKAERARRIAAEWAAEVRLGRDPGGQRQDARQAPTMGELFDRFMSDHAQAKKKASSIGEDERLIRLFLRPAFGPRKVAEVARAEIDRFHKGLVHKPYRANRCLAVLSKAFNLAEVWGWRPDGTNPVRHISKYAEKKRKRFLSPAELGRLGDALRRAERGELEQPVSPYAIAAIRLLSLTGARKSEILGLQWHWIDSEAGRANLPDSKTGEKTLILPPPAIAVLKAIPPVEGNPHVIVGGKPGAALVNLKDPWALIRDAAGLPGVRIHDLRHSFASVGAAGGQSLLVIGALLGHSQPQTTARYAHLSDDPVRAAAAAIGGRIAAVMAGSDTDGDVIAMRRG